MASSAPASLDLDITGIAHGGTFIARHEGRVVFVSDAIPGERVRARITDPSTGSGTGSTGSGTGSTGSGTGSTGSGADSRKFWRAETVEVLEASPYRHAHVWPDADMSHAPEMRAGGADLGHIDLEHQRVLKQQVLSEALDKFAGPGLEAPTVAAIDDSDGTGWRTRISLHVDAEGNVGPYAARSHRVIPVSSHPLARPTVAAEALSLRNAKPGRIDLVESSDGAVHVLRRPERGKRPASRVVVERVGDRSFQVDADGFWQVHHAAAAALDDAVKKVLAGRVDSNATHFDLYGGVGLLASSLAAAGAEDIVTVESSSRATAHARENLADFGATAVTARVDRYLASLPDGAQAGTVVLDPPRAGAGRAVVEGVHALHPDAVVYVACDPVALARDLGTFRQLGWNVESLEAFDLFPHSHHFETIALLSR